MPFGPTAPSESELIEGFQIFIVVYLFIYMGKV
jgi:hypothetical protein